MSHNKNSVIIQYSQNTTVNKKLIQKLVNQSSITEGDWVYDIGAGSGVISEALTNKGAKVIAIEKNQELYQKCKEKFVNEDRFEGHHIDFLKWEFPQDQRYKVFSNIPFIQTADIVTKIVLNKSPPEDCYLILQKEAAEKYTGIPEDTLVSLLIKPIFWIDIIYYFKRTDFFPVSSVDIVLLQVEKRKCQLVSDQHYSLYRDFIIFCREGADQTIKKSMKRLFTYSQLKKLSKLLGIDYCSSPTNLSFTKYLGIFQFYLHHTRRYTESLIHGAADKMHRQQADRVKTHRTKQRRRTR